MLSLRGPEAPGPGVETSCAGGCGEASVNWHVDLMYVRITSRWFYLIDLLDGYSRFLVHWRLALTLRAEEVTMVVQEVLEGLPPGLSPRIIRDNGSQFASGEWRRFLHGAQLDEIRTRLRHPQSNGKLERLHRTHRTEGPFAQDPGRFKEGLAAMGAYREFYNRVRPHSALHFLPPATWHLGDPEETLRHRNLWLDEAGSARATYWKDRRGQPQRAHVAEPGAQLPSRAAERPPKVTLDGGQRPAILPGAPG